jgi:hypothetical protein
LPSQVNPGSSCLQYRRRTRSPSFFLSSGISSLACAETTIAGTFRCGRQVTDIEDNGEVFREFPQEVRKQLPIFMFLQQTGLLTPMLSAEAHGISAQAQAAPAALAALGGSGSLH